MRAPYLDLQPIAPGSAAHLIETGAEFLIGPMSRHIVVVAILGSRGSESAATHKRILAGVASTGNVFKA